MILLIVAVTASVVIQRIRVSAIILKGNEPFLMRFIIAISCIHARGFKEKI